jgi:hypothetical protein
MFCHNIPSFDGKKSPNFEKKNHHIVKLSQFILLNLRTITIFKNPIVIQFKFSSIFKTNFCNYLDRFYKPVTV